MRLNGYGGNDDGETEDGLVEGYASLQGFY
mgnify:CR=1 FL=1